MVHSFPDGRIQRAVVSGGKGERGHFGFSGRAEGAPMIAIYIVSGIIVLAVIGRGIMAVERWYRRIIERMRAELGP